MDTYDMYIDGEWVPASTGKTFETVNPWTQKAIAAVPEGTSEDVDIAVAAARRAFEECGWRKSAHQRAKTLRRFADLIDANVERLARLESDDNGKVIREERGMYGGMGNYYRYVASLAETLTDSIPTGLNPDVLALTRRAPFGVIGIQTPWNTPGLILTQSASSALAAGNTIVVKPSELAPVSTLALAELAHEAGFPPGVFNVVTGMGAVVGARLCNHPGVDKLVFTGSPEGGRIVARQAADRLASVVMELGGKSANVVFADADIEKAAAAVASGFTAAAGQSCMCGGRAIIEDSVYDEILERVIAHVDKLTLGDPSLDTTDIGPAAAASQLDRITNYIDIAQNEGAKLLYGGSRLADVHPLLVEPTIFTEVTPDMRIFREEVFGPVLAVSRFSSEAEAVQLANDTDFGLSLAVWTKSLDRAHRVAEAFDAGVIWVNQYRRGDPSYANGGIERSGYGRVSGREGFLEMTYPKSIQILLDRN